MKKRLLLLIIIGAVVFLFLKLFSNSKSSQDQKDTVELMGNPAQFVITYLPQGDDNETTMVRSEVWYYPQQEKSLHFLSGNLISTEDYLPESESEATEQTDLFPSDFDVMMNLDELEVALDEVPQQLYELPGFDEDGFQTFMTSKAVFTIENGYLTYFETVGLGEESDVDVMEENQAAQEMDEILEPENPIPNDDSSGDVTVGLGNRIADSVYDFSIEVPESWVFDTDAHIFASYDMGYLEKGLELPAERFKCDFVPQITSDVVLDNLGEFLSNDSKTKVSKFLVIDILEADYLGFGDGIIYRFETNSNNMYLICFTLYQELEEDLETVLKTYEYEK